MKTRTFVIPLVLALALGLIGLALMRLNWTEQENPPPTAAQPVRTDPQREEASEVQVAPIPVQAEPVEEPVTVDPEPEPQPLVSGRGAVVDYVEPAKPDPIERTRDNSTLTQLQTELRGAEAELTRRKELLGKAEWSKGNWREHKLGQGMPRPELSWDGVPEELILRRGKNSQGQATLKVVPLPFELYPEYYELKREAIRLRSEIRMLEPE